jgi:SAM-dependent methyltransferase
MTAPPRIFDRDLHRRRLDRAARGPGGADFLHDRVAADLAGRLQMMSRDFPLAIEIGARRGALHQALAASPPPKVGLLIEAGLSAPMLAGGGLRMVADEERLPLVPGSVDLVVSALAMHWTNDLVGALIQIRRALAPDGLLLASLLGGATLTELRQSLMSAEVEVLGGAGPRVSPFADAADAGSLLQRAGFTLPVVDVDTVTVTYEHPLRLFADLRAMGETSVLIQRPGALSRAVLARTCEIYQRQFSGPGGRIAASFEIVTLTGWAQSAAATEEG